MAPQYRKIDLRIWSDEKFQFLTPSQKLLALYLLTSPQSNRLGIFTFSVALAAEDLGVTPQGVRHDLDTLCHTLSWRCATPFRLVWIPKYLTRYNPPSNESHWLGMLEDLHTIPDCELLSEFITVANEYAEKRGFSRVSREVSTPCPTLCATPSPTPCPTPSGTPCATPLALSLSSALALKETPLPPKGGTGFSSLELPFQTEEFESAWGAWVAYRRESRKKLSPSTAARQLKQFAAWGELKSISSIEASIRNGWSGLFEPQGEVAKVNGEVISDARRKELAAEERKARDDAYRRWKSACVIAVGSGKPEPDKPELLQSPPRYYTL